MIILAIETSCDETAISVLKTSGGRRRPEFKILSLKPPKIDIIAVTHGPGLEPALWVGVNFAKALGFFWKKPIIGINHLEGHALANWLIPIGKKSQFPISNFQKVFPALCLIVSGGHTQLVLM